MYKGVLVMSLVAAVVLLWLPLVLPPLPPPPLILLLAPVVLMLLLFSLVLVPSHNCAYPPPGVSWFPRRVTEPFVSIVSALDHPALARSLDRPDRATDMQRSSSFGTSWADQWDYGGDASPRAAARGHNAGKDGSGGAAGKTKAAAASGLKKVKEGTAQGFQWIKDKCQRKNGNGGGGKKQTSSEVAGY